MTADNLSEQLEQFNAFYLIKHPVKVNIEAATEADAKQSLQAFEQAMPYAFRIASQMAEVESRALRPFRSMGEKFDELVDYLQLQAQKMDLMMSYILQQQDDPACRFTATKFGGGGVVVIQPSSVALGDYATIKVFVESEAAAVYAIGQVVDCQTIEGGDDESEAAFEVSYAFVLIREDDQELLVRASLHLQTAQLRKKQAKSDD
uniref:PilZ domain-containing protein n=1 Tax=Ningiella ruwaisensis TaxID=2364274 RepID=UPI00109F38B1|nr:PilZ domain-containing protein [Ningiella ruwaisensis]